MKKCLIIIFTLFTTLFVNAQYNVSEVQYSFKSTSTMTMSGSNYASTPMLNKYGMAEYKVPSYGSNGIGILKTEGNTGTPGSGEFQQPIGDVPIIAVICFVCIYLFWYKKEKGDK